MKSKEFLSIAVSFILVTAIFLPAWTPLKAASPAKPIELSYACHQPPVGPVSVMFSKGWAEDVEKATGGRVKVTIHWSQTLGKTVEQYNTAVKGVADVTWGYQSWSPGRFPLSSGLELPFLFPSGIAASRAIWEMYSTSKYLKPEYTDVKVLGLSAMDPKNIFMAKKPVHTLSDLKGMKIRCQGIVETKTVESLPATPVAMMITEVYTALERGIVDGTLIATAPINTFRFDRVLKYATEVSLGCGTFFLVMNRKTWDSLPPDVQNKIDEVSGSRISEIGGKSFDIESAEAWKLLAEHGVERYRLPPDEFKRWKEAVAPLYDWWVDDMQAKGLPGKEVFGEILRLSEKYSK
jgi:TRAP-type C4-dicarboxylate transport system substrate-binding protein